jgi:hypothetical protein
LYDPTVTPPRNWEELSVYVLLYGFFTAIGASVTILILILVVWPQWRVNTLFVETVGTVVDQREVSGEGGTSRQLQLRYSAHGRMIQHWNKSIALVCDEGNLQQRIRGLEMGERLAVWYDPEMPEVVVINRGYCIHWMLYPFIVASGFFVLFGVSKIIVGAWRFRA